MPKLVSPSRTSTSSCARGRTSTVQLGTGCQRASRSSPSISEIASFSSSDRSWGAAAYAGRTRRVSLQPVSAANCTSTTSGRIRYSNDIETAGTTEG